MLSQYQFYDAVRHIDNHLHSDVSWTTSSGWLYAIAQQAYRRRLPINNPARRARVRHFLNGIRTGAGGRV